MRTSFSTVLLLLIAIPTMAQTPDIGLSEPDVERRVDSILDHMTLEEKIGQLTLLNGAGGHVSDELRHEIAAGRVGAVLNEVDIGTVNEMQRLAIARAIAANPALLIADEPTTALDVTVQAQILQLLEDIRDETALLLITHDLGVIAGHCEHMIVLEQGRVVDAGPTTSLFAAPGHEHTRRLIEAAPRVDRGEPPAPVSSTTVLSVGNAVVDYDDQRAVNDVSFAVHAGETVAVVGESGSGKSSLVRGLLGLLPLAAGRVIYAGERLAGPVQKRAQAQRRDLQLVFQDPLSALDPQMRVRTIVEEPLVIHEAGLTAAERRARVIAVLEKVGLGEKYLRRFPHELSGGQAQRVSIARALVLGPKVLVCDEAVAALNEAIRLDPPPSAGIDQLLGPSATNLTLDFGFDGMLIAVLPPGAFFGLAGLLAARNWLNARERIE